MADDEQKPTTPLMAMINGRSQQALAPTLASPHFPVPSQTEADIRRRNLMLSQATGTQNGPGSPGNSKKRVLAPESSSPQQAPGGFLQPGEVFDQTMLQFRPPPAAVSRRDDADEDLLGTQKLHHGGGSNGTMLQPPAVRVSEPPRKKLMRGSDYEQRNSRDTSAEVEEVSPYLTSPIASGSASPITSPGNEPVLPGTNTPITAMGRNLQHVHLQRTSSNTSSTASLHGRSGLSRTDDDSLPSALEAARVPTPTPVEGATGPLPPISASAEASTSMAVDANGDIEVDSSSPAIGRRRRRGKATKIVEDDDDDGDGDFEPDGDAESDDDYEPEPPRAAPAPAPLHVPRPQQSAPQYQHYQPKHLAPTSAHGHMPMHPQPGSATIPSQRSPGLATIPGVYHPQAMSMPQQHIGMQHMQSQGTPYGYGVPSPGLVHPGSHPGTPGLAGSPPPQQMTMQPALPQQQSSFGSSHIAAAQQAFVHFRQTRFPTLPFELVRQAWIDSGGNPDIATNILQRNAGQVPVPPAQWTSPANTPTSASMPSPGMPPGGAPGPSTMYRPVQPPYTASPMAPMVQTQVHTTRVTMPLPSPGMSLPYRSPGLVASQQHSPHLAMSPQATYSPGQLPPYIVQQRQQQEAMRQQQRAYQPMQQPGQGQRPMMFQQQHPSQHQQYRPIVQQQYVAQQQQPQPRKKRRTDDSDSDGGYSDNDGGGGYTERNRHEKELQALTFFNECKVEDLQDLTTCTPAQTKMVGELRPFDSVDDLRQKLRKTKGISANLFDNYVDVIQAYSAVDKVFDECKRVGNELNRTMEVWKAAAKAAVPKEEAKAATDEDSQEAGVHFTQLNDELVKKSLELPNASPYLKEAFQGYLHAKPKGVPDEITLKGYQMLGINWLYLLYRKKHSCILADEMGLGKTCQVIAFLAHIKSIGESGPHLIVVPSSTLENWMREFHMFAPDLRVVSYYGSQREREEMRYDIKEEMEKDPLDVIVTTYNIAAGSNDDRKFLRKMRFKTCTYDEGHQLKNSESKKHKDLMALDVPWRLLLTGTPLQNNLTELISLLSFILPDIIGRASEELRAIFKVPVGAKSNLLSKRRIEAAKNVMTPFVMRRKKLQVLQELPSKSERIEYCDLSPMQREVYREAVMRSKKALTESTDNDEAIVTAMLNTDSPAPIEEKPKPAAAARGKKAFTKKGTLRVQQHSSANVLMDLRKAANHPMLFRRLYDDAKIRIMAKDCLREIEFSDRDPDLIYEDMDIMTDYELHRFVQPYQKLKAKHELKHEEWMQAGKVEALKRLLPEHLDKGDRVLLFSQFTQVLDILETVLDTMGIRYLKLTGQTNVIERQGLVDDFYADEGIGVFLLSTRAGGLGINLAAANVVIMHDQDFNPHNDRQAEDRAWRIGQQRDVQVIRLITRGTIEEDIYALAQTKLALDKEVTSHVASADAIMADAPAEPTEVTEAKVDKPATATKGRGRKAAAATAAAAAAGKSEGGIAEGDEAMAAKQMSKSLLSRMRDRFAEEDKDSKPQNGTGASSSAPPTSDVPDEAMAEDETKAEAVNEAAT